MDADTLFLEEYERELDRIGNEFGRIGQLLDKEHSEKAWKAYDKLRSSLMSDRASLRNEFERMEKAETHIRKLLS